MRTRRFLSSVAVGAVVAIAGLMAGYIQHASADVSPDVALEQRLADQSYDPGPVDGTFDDDTAYAITAFQKVHGMDRTGQATDDVRAAIAATTAPPAALVSDGGPNRVEVDLGRQVLFVYENGTLLKTLPVSTGSGEEFCSEGSCRNAVTDEGSFAIYRHVDGWDSGPLGDLYNPEYFDGGIAIHGATSVPAEPASHGCVRIPMDAAEWFPQHVSEGTPVYVVAGGQPEPLSPAASAPAAPAASPAAPSPAPAPTTPSAPSTPAPSAPLSPVLHH